MKTNNIFIVLNLPKFPVCNQTQSLKSQNYKLLELKIPINGQLLRTGWCKSLFDPMCTPDTQLCHRHFAPQQTGSCCFPSHTMLFLAHSRSYRSVTIETNFIIPFNTTTKESQVPITFLCCEYNRGNVKHITRLEIRCATAALRRFWRECLVRWREKRWGIVGGLFDGN